MAEKAKTLWSQIALFGRTYRFLIFVITSYLLIAAYYLGPSITQCTDTVYGFGDNTAGPIWRHSVYPGSPVWGFTQATNFPFGENLYSPIHFSAILQYTTYWLMQVMFGTVCGMNVVSLLGFFSTAFMMYFFIRWLTGNRWIAWFAGYAVAFTPYYQYKVGGHPSYGYSMLLIACLWLTLKLLETRRLRDAILLGMAFAACFYWDPYFSLLAVLTIGPIVSVWLLLSFIGRKSRSAKLIRKQQLVRLAIAVATATVFIIPLGVLKVVKSAEINSVVSGARGDVMLDAQMCSILPWEYVIPSDTNYFANKIVGPSLSDELRALHRGCNPSEYTTGISIVILLIVTVGLLIFAWEKLNGRPIFRDIRTGRNYRLAIIAFLAVLIVAMLFALPPIIGNLRNPSYYLLQITSIWRILARIYVVVNIVMVALAALVLLYLSKLPVFKNKTLRIVFFIILFLAVFVQYQAFKPLSGSQATFSYSKDLPSIYYWLRGQPDIKNIAAYPLDKVGETDAISVYLTAQYIHKKPMVNSTLSAGREDSLRYSIKDLTDPQTIPVLRMLNVDALLIHGVDRDVLENIPSIKVVHYQEFANGITGGKVAVAKILPGKKATEVTRLEQGFPLNGLIMRSPVSIEFETVDKAVVRERPVKPDSKIAATSTICFDAKTTYPGLDLLTIKVENRTLGTYQLTEQYASIRVTAPVSQDITLTNSTGANMRLNNLGCK